MNKYREPGLVWLLALSLGSFVPECRCYLNFDQGRPASASSSSSLVCSCDEGEGAHDVVGSDDLFFVQSNLALQTRNKTLLGAMTPFQLFVNPDGYQFDV